MSQLHSNVLFAIESLSQMIDRCSSTYRSIEGRLTVYSDIKSRLNGIRSVTFTDKDLTNQVDVLIKKIEQLQGELEC